MVKNKEIKLSENNKELTATEIIDQKLNQTSISTKELSKILSASERPANKSQ